MSVSRSILVTTPQILWHGGANENGKPDPIYSVDFHPKEALLATGGIDGNLPANGCVRVCHLSSMLCVTPRILFCFVTCVLIAVDDERTARIFLGD